MARRKALTESELKLIAPKRTDEELFDKFFHDCTIRNLREATIAYYKREIMLAKRIINKNLVDWTDDDVESFIIKSKERMKVTSINTRLRDLRAFFNFAYKKKLIKKNPIKNLSLLRDRIKEIETLESEEIERLLKNMRKYRTFVSFRDEVIMLVFLDTGVRLSELVSIDVNDVKKGKIIIRRTKNLLERTVFISDITQERLTKWIQIRGDEAETNRLFISQDLTQLQPHSIQTRFQKYGREAKINKRGSPHTFRHTMAKRMIISGVDAFTLMTILGHQDMTITKRYINLWGPDIERKHKRHGALKGLKL